MRRWSLFVLPFIAASCMAARSAGAEPGPRAISIEHAGVACLLAEQFPRFEAHVTAAESAAHTRVYFRASATPDWYFVEMTGDGDVFSGVLPKPRRDVKQVEYYIEAVGTDFAQARTPEYQPRVVSPGQCAREGLGAEAESAASSSKVAVGSLTGKRTVPDGFSSAGIEKLKASSTQKTRSAHRTPARDSNKESGKRK